MKRHSISFTLLPSTHESCTGSQKNHQTVGPNAELLEGKNYFSVPYGKTSHTYVIPDVFLQPSLKDNMTEISLSS